MNSKLLNWETTLESMKSAFNLSFANESANLENNEKEDFLILQIYKDQYAVRVSELRALQIKKRIVPIPCENKVFLGLAGMQGQVVPIFSLALILNIQTQATEEYGRENNFITCGKTSQIGLSFLKLGDYHQVSRENIIPQQITQNYFVSFMVRFHIPSSQTLIVLPILNIEAITNFISKNYSYTTE